MSSSSLFDQFDDLDIAPLDQFDPKDWDTWSGVDCPVCGVPWGTGGCHRCLLVAAQIFDFEDRLDEL